LNSKRPGRKLFLIPVLLLLICFSRRAETKDTEDKRLNMDSPFGVLEFLNWNHKWNHYKYSDNASLQKVVKLMKEANVGWVRMDFAWEEIEPQAGRFDFKKYDNVVSLLGKNNINILGLLDYTASWASYDGKWNSPPKENKLFVNYALKTIERYKDKIKYWEVWNEPDFYVYWSKQDGLVSYCALLKEVYTAAKKINPDCKILNGGLANGISSVNHLYDNGAKDYFDVLNLHVFESPLHSRSLSRIAAFPRLAYKIMARNGDGHKKIWITEIGCPGVKANLKVKNWWLGVNPSERQQARWLKQIYCKLLENKNIDKVFWAFFRDCNRHWNNGVDYFGLVRWDFSKKPAFLSYKEQAKKKFSPLPLP
jgi:hypothetical protein